MRTRFLELPGFQPDALFFATRMALSMLLAYYVAFAAQVDSASSVGICVAIVAQPSAGMSTAKAIYRVVGTLIGGCVGVALVAAFPQDRVMLLAGFALWLAFCTFVAALLRDFRSYGAALSGYTAGIITVGAIDAPQLALITALDRVAAILIGVASVLVVGRLLSGAGAFNALVAELRDRTEAMAAMAADALDGRPVGDDMAMVRIAAGVAALQTQASYTAVELPDGRLRANGARHAIAALLAMVSASRAIIGTLGPDAPDQHVPAEMRAWLHAVADALRAHEGRPKDGSVPSHPAPQPRCPVDALLLERAEELLASHEHALAGLRTLTDGDGVMPPIRLQVARDPVAALFGALRVLISIGFGAVFCVVAGWGGATLVLIQQAAFVALLGTFPNPSQASLQFGLPLLPVALLTGAAKFLLGRPTPGRVRLLEHIYGMGEVDLATRQARTGLAGAVATAPGLGALAAQAGRALQREDAPAMLRAAQELLDQQADGPAGHPVRLAVSGLAGAARLLQPGRATLRFYRRLAA